MENGQIYLHLLQYIVAGGLAVDMERRYREPKYQTTVIISEDCVRIPISGYVRSHTTYSGGLKWCVDLPPPIPSRTSSPPILHPPSFSDLVGIGNSWGSNIWSTKRESNFIQEMAHMKCGRGGRRGEGGGGIRELGETSRLTIVTWHNTQNKGHNLIMLWFW